MKALLFIVCLIFLIGGCSSKRTPYQKFKKEEGGYAHRVLDDELEVISFKGNSRTKPNYTGIFARFRSLEDCRRKGKKLSHVLGLIDRTSTKKILRSNGDVWGPSYSYGVGGSPFYSRYSGFGFSTGINVVNSRTWEETLVFPEMEAIYNCTDKAFEPEIVMRDVSPDEMKHLIKDLKGGVQVEEILPGSPNKELREEDIIIRAKGERITRGYQVLALFKEGPSPVDIEVLREGKKKSLTLKARDVSEKVQENLSSLVKTACDFKDVKKESSFCH